MVVGESEGQEEGDHGIFNDVLVAPTKPSRVGIGSAADDKTEGWATNGADIDCRENGNMQGTENPPVSTGDEDTMALVTEGILRRERDQHMASIFEDSPYAHHGRLFRRPVGPVLALPSGDEDFPVVPKSWLYGHMTLQQTGQSIGAELEVAMLCMQKRLAKVKTTCWVYCISGTSAGLETPNSHMLKLLAHAPPTRNGMNVWQEPIVIGDESEATDVLKQEVVVVKMHGKLEKGSQKDSVVGTEDGNKQGGWLQESLEVLADNMASRTLRETSELDRELGLDFSDDIFDGVGQRGVSTKRARGLPAGVGLNGELSPSASGLDTGAVGAVKKESGPPASSRSYFPRRITYDIPDDSPLSRRGKPQQDVNSKTESALRNMFEVEATAAGATNIPLNPSASIPPTLVPGDDASFRRSPPTPVPQAGLGRHVSSFRLPRATRSFVSGNAEARDQDRVNGNIRPPTDRVARRETYSQQQRPIEYDDVDDDEWGPGFALARARRRLRSFQTARRSMSTPSERHHRHPNLSPPQISEDRQAVQRQPHVGGQNLLNRLKCMRRTYSLNASPREE